MCEPVSSCEPVSLPPVATPRERIVLRLISWGVAILLHVALFWIAGNIVEYLTEDFEITVNWSNEPLMGFGMMDVYEDSDVNSEPYEPPPKAEATDDPFENDAETPETTAAPTLDPNSIVIPEPEPEPEPEQDNVPSYDLSRDKVRMAAVRADVQSMPNLHVLAPGNAKLIVLIRNDRVIGSKFENSVRRLFRAFPDYRVALGASEIDPVRDIQAMLIATANPQLYAETFLVVSHHIPADKLQKYITASFPTRLNWQTHNNRPHAVPDHTDGKFNPRSGIYRRSLYLPDDNTVLFLKPEILPTLDVAHVDAAVHVRDKDLKNNPEAAQTFLESLGGISTSDSLSMPTIFLMVQGIEGIKLGRNFPEFEPPVAMVGSMSTADNPILNLEATFKTPEAARQFVAIWPEILAASGRMGVPGVSGLLSALSLAPESERVLLTGELNGTMIGLVLMFASSYLERNT